jgi:hypothetical protein
MKTPDVDWAIVVHLLKAPPLLVDFGLAVWFFFSGGLLLV